MAKEKKSKKTSVCYVCKEVEAADTLSFMFRDAKGMQELSLAICETCKDNYKVFNKVLTIFMMFTTFIFMALISFIAYLYLQANDVNTALYIFVFTVPVSFLGFYIHKRLYHGSHFVQKAAQEPTISTMLKQGYKGFIIKSPND